MIGEFRRSLYPFIIIDEDGYDSEIITQFLTVRSALDALIAQKISWQEYLEIIESQGVNIEDYLETAEQNLISVGF